MTNESAIDHWAMRKPEFAKGDTLDLIYAIIPYLRQRKRSADALDRGLGEEINKTHLENITYCNENINRILGICDGGTARF